MASLARPRTAIIMVQAGEGTDAVIEQLAELFEPGDIIVDGGNADFHDTIRREKRRCAAKGLNFVGTGISGGEEGALNGPSIMPGGSAEAYETLGPILASIAAVAEGEPCVTHVGTDGAGHFVKMIHNGIEYADMQLIAEAYDLLRRVGGHEPPQIADVFEEWNTGDLESYLIEITAEVLRQVDAETGTAARRRHPRRGRLEGHRRLDGAERARPRRPGRRHRRGGLRPRRLDQARAARRRCAPAVERRPEIQAAGAELRRRRTRGSLRLEGRRLRAGLRRDRRRSEGVRLGHRQRRDRQDLAGRLHHPGAVPQPHRRCLRNATPTSRRCSTTTTSPTRSPTARTRGGASSSTAALSGVPVPGFSSALSYYDSLASDRLPAALIQGQRDFFGAHTYKRIDKEGVFHTLWSGDRSEIAIEPHDLKRPRPVDPRALRRTRDRHRRRGPRRTRTHEVHPTRGLASLVEAITRGQRSPLLGPAVRQLF